jgi:hypothetical protein
MVEGAAEFESAFSLIIFETQSLLQICRISEF